ncbi:Excinuclease ABC subunit C [Caminicella sporogenes DSM 14501]|uniref:UvrABC system protein C n=1 Tax=Caminicella sporogenes DSM 14501 TaxID=1121266 RepID=A0A1M6QLM6_9FIRM|nr:excinuclease ABC subunit UvrC [Caminicella sporogenes]RKD25267.1 excinuclease ABC subunit C [Caminicella sporogenes]SHK21152.1 Excinuclease ABC subunit C [Caminicella sporogenes DSM 14501]
MFDIKEQIRKLPDKPGVYLMKDDNGEIIYVGKSKSLKNRVSSYFRAVKSHPPKVQAMVKSIREFEYIITDTEVEALILEANLIKKHRPKFNVLLRDDKSYPYIKVTVNEKYPRVLMTRKILKDKAKYFGPYINVFAVKQMLETIEQMYPLKKCSKNLENNKDRPCLNYHIKKCIGPCTGNVNYDEYMEMINDIILFLSGKQEILIGELEKKMNNAASQLNFEKAAKYRDKINALKLLSEKQKVVSTSDGDQDYISMARSNDKVCVMIFFVRGGKLIGREHYILEGTEDIERDEILSTFTKQFYSGTSFIPKEIIIDEMIVEDKEVIEKWLSQKKGSKVIIKEPKKGEKRKLLELVYKNAEEYLAKFEEKINKEREFLQKSLQEIKELLNLDKLPKRIEAYDISNMHGVFSVGSMVVFEDGKPVNSAYRKFKIKTVEGPNDYGSIQEVLYRRFKKGIEECELLEKHGLKVEEGKFSVLPDIIFIDGGKGQVNSAKDVLKAFGLNIPIAGMVKDDKHRTKGLVYENREVLLDKRSFSFKLIAKIQDEVHRFAITYHKVLRDKAMIQSVLDKIPGIGKKRKTELLKHFGLIENIKNASVEDLEAVKGMNKKVAENVYNFFNSKKQ